MKRIRAFCLVLLAFSANLTAGEFGCPHCRTSDKICVVKATQSDEKETCYEVECEEVCVPAVRFPWESCRTSKCGRVRVVAKLKKESRETKVCGYEWQIACPRCGRRPSSGVNGEACETRVPPLPPTPAAAPIPEARRHREPASGEAPVEMAWPTDRSVAK